ncbi:MAG: 50S ribosomal protein L37Ae [archaeon]
MGHTKKVGSTGRFKGRYGVGVKKRVLEVENRMKAKVPCPFCGFERIKREAAGLFACTKCGNRFTGGAYEPQTLVGKAINKMVTQKSFLETAQALIKSKESSFSDIEREVESSLTGRDSSNVSKDLPKKKKNKKEVKQEEVVDVVEESEDAVDEESDNKE